MRCLRCTYVRATGAARLRRPSHTLAPPPVPPPSRAAVRPAFRRALRPRSPTLSSDGLATGGRRLRSERSLGLRNARDSVPTSARAPAKSHPPPANGGRPTRIPLPVAASRGRCTLPTPAPPTAPPPPRCSPRCSRLAGWWNVTARLAATASATLAPPSPQSHAPPRPTTQRPPSRVLHRLNPPGTHPQPPPRCPPHPHAHLRPRPPTPLPAPDPR